MMLFKKFIYAGNNADTSTLKVSLQTSASDITEFIV